MERVRPFKTIWKNRELIIELSKRDLIDKYKGQILGSFWTFFHPMVMIFIYIFLFGIVFKTRMVDDTDSTLTYSAYLLSGMIPWMCIQMSMIQGSMAIIMNTSLVKQVVFPLEVLPIKAVVSAFFIELIYIVIDIIYIVIVAKGVLWTFLLIPVAILLQLLFLLGVSYILSAFAVFIRDTKDIIQVLCTVGIYLMPVVYQPNAVPSIFRPILYINPFSHYIYIFQDILFFGRLEHIYSWIICSIISFSLFYIGTWWFQNLKRGFSSII